MGIGSLRFEITDLLLARMIGPHHGFKQLDCELELELDSDQLLNYVPRWLLKNFSADFGSGKFPIIVKRINKREKIIIESLNQAW